MTVEMGCEHCAHCVGVLGLVIGIALYTPERDLFAEYCTGQEVMGPIHMCLPSEAVYKRSIFPRAGEVCGPTGTVTSCESFSPRGTSEGDQQHGRATIVLDEASVLMAMYTHRLDSWKSESSSDDGDMLG